VDEVVHGCDQRPAVQERNDVVRHVEQVTPRDANRKFDLFAEGVQGCGARDDCDLPIVRVRSQPFRPSYKGDTESLISGQTNEELLEETTDARVLDHASIDDDVLYALGARQERTRELRGFQPGTGKRACALGRKRFEPRYRTLTVLPKRPYRLPVPRRCVPVGRSRPECYGFAGAEPNRRTP